MPSPQPHFDHQQFAALVARLGIADQVLDSQALSGLALAVLSAPDLIETSEWFPLAFLDASGEVAEPAFESAADADAFYDQLHQLVGVWNAILAQDADIPLPEDCGLDADGQPSAALRDFCDGVLVGFDWLDEVWSEVLDEVAEINSDLGEVFDSTVTACMLLNDPQATRASLEQNDGMAIDEQMTCAEAIEVFRSGMRILANFGRDVAALLEEEG
ncbi:MAG: UPF0149 family protein [Porticoccaceae bacterium]|jgi:uncharacterized protein